MGVSALGCALIAATCGASAYAASNNGVCESGEFCAFAYSGYGTLILESQAPVGTGNVQVAHDTTSSVKNNTANCWIGVNERTLLPDQQLILIPQYTALSVLGVGVDNKIDHFKVVANSSC